MRKGIRVMAPWVLLGLAFLVAPDALAGTSGASSVTQTFINATNGWYGTLKGIAEEIFYALFGIDFVYLVSQWLIGGKDVHEVFTSFIKKLMTIGVFFTILLNGHELVGWVINGFKASGVAVAGQPQTGIGWILLTGWHLFEACVKGPVQSGGGTVKYIWDTLSSGGQTVISTLIGALVGFVVGLIAILALIYLALEYLAIQLEAALVASVGIIMMGFAGSRWTVQHAEGYLKYALSVGIRFMVLVIWIAFIENHSPAIITNLLNGVKQSGGTNIGTTLSAYANVLIFVLLIAWMAKKLPAIASSVMTGGSSLSGGELFGAAVGGGALAAAAVATGGAALAGAGAAGGTGVLTGAQAAAMDAGAAGSLSGAAGGTSGGGAALGGNLVGSGAAGSTEPGMVNAVQAPPPPTPAGAGGGVQAPPPPEPMPRDPNRDPNKPLSMAERFKGTHGLIRDIHKHTEPVLLPGKAETSGVQAAGLGLKHSE
jgi:type IV secretion system protein TrbL